MLREWNDRIRERPGQARRDELRMRFAALIFWALILLGVCTALAG